MSENLQQENIIKALQDALDSVDEKYHDNTRSENCTKCLEKLNIYAQFTSDLINRCLCPHFHHDSDDVPKCKLEETNSKVQHDLNTVRDCLDSRKEIEKQAIESLSEGMMKIATQLFILEFTNNNLMLMYYLTFQLNCVAVESMVESMLKDYCRVLDENQHLSEELKHCDEVARENFNFIAQLEEELREKSESNATAYSSNGKLCVDSKNEIDKLQKQLDERDKMIAELLVKLNDLNVQESNDQNVTTPNVFGLSSKEQSSDSEFCDSISMDSSDASQKLRHTVKDLEEISTKIEATLNKKDIQLCDQQVKIDELTKQLEQSDRLNEESESKCMIKLKEMEEHNQILANQAMLLEEQLEILLDKHNKLIQSNNDLIESISICQKEICKYNFE